MTRLITIRLMTTRLALAALVLPLTLPGAAFAQSSQTGGGSGAAEIKQPGPKQITTPGQGQADFVKPGGAANSGPGANAVEVRGGGTGAATRSSDSGVAGNAERPEAPVGNNGGGGGSGGSNN